MNREYNSWVSPVLERKMEMLIFGQRGIPTLVFPTAKGRFFDYEDHGMVEALSSQLDRGAIQLFCVDSIDAESWHNPAIPPKQRIARHVQYERYILDEVIPFVKKREERDEVFVTGCNFGGYHAMNLTLRHPRDIAGCFCLSGTFDIRPLLDGYFDQDSYYNNPVEYLALLTDEKHIRQYRDIRFVLAAGEWDYSLDENLKFSHLLDTKGVRHWLDVWGDHTKHDWPWWQMMIRKFLS